MSEPSRTRANRRRNKWQVEAVEALEQKALLAPFLTTNVKTATFDPFDNQPTTQNFGTVDVNEGAASNFSSAPYVSVSQLTPLSEFGNDIVRLEAGPGGDFGKSLYAISRGNNTAGPPIGTGGRPGVIYRIDPATGKAGVFFDLNTVLNQASPGTNASNSAGSQTGLVNWYDITFDETGVFDGLPSMFVASVDQTNPLKNVIYRIGSDGKFLGMFIPYTDGQSAGALTQKPSAIHVPAVEQQRLLRGLFAGNGTNDSVTYTGIFFDSNGFQPGQPITGTTLPRGASDTLMNLGPAVGITDANNNYASRVYTAFTDFGQPGIPGFSPEIPGVSGIQGNLGDFLIQNNTGTGNAGTNVAGGYPPGGSSVVANFPIRGDGTPDVELGAVQAGAGTPSGIDSFSAIGTPYRRFQDITFDQFGYFSYGTTVTDNGGGALPTVGTPTYAGSTFVTDLGTGLAVEVDFPADFGDGSAILPVQGSGGAGLQIDPNNPGGLSFTTPGRNLGGRVIRVLPDGTVTPFAEGFNTSGVDSAGSFAESSLSITFSADGTTLYVSDNDGIWQFKSTMALATSTSGSLIGLNDLRTLGAPFDGQDTAVAVIDTGIDANTPQFRGRVAPGINVLTNGTGNDDYAPNNGHGTLVAGVVAQFVPDSTLVPVSVFSPLLVTPATTNQALWQGLKWVADNPFVEDPTQPGQVDRIVTATMGFGTTSTFDTEGTAFRQYSQLVLSFKSQLQRYKRLGIAPVAAAGQFGVPIGGTGIADAGDVQGMSLPAILNEVISVTGTSPFPFRNSPIKTPNDPASGPLGRDFGPVTVVGSGQTAPAFTAGDTLLFQDKILAASNRGYTTDYGAPAIDVPTFGRTFVGDGNANNIFDESGTSLSAGIISGSYTMLASALDYYSELAIKGFTVDGYLNTPVDSLQLDYGPSTLRNLSMYNNPDGINSILQWTAVPVADSDIPGASVVTPPMSLAKPTQYRDFARVDIGNAVAAVEGSIALPYLINSGAMQVIDSNSNGFITAQEIQNFVDKSSTIGMSEAGALARFLGGTASPPYNREVSGPREFITDFVTSPIARLGFTSQEEQPDQPDALARRFVFFDWVADGKLDGVVSLDQYTMLAHTLLPAPDSFAVSNRIGGSTGGFLVDADAVRNISDLQRLLPSYAFASGRGPWKRYLNPNFSPNRFGINRGVPSLNQTPVYTLFDPSATEKVKKARSQASTPKYTAESNPAAKKEAAADTASTPSTAVSRTNTQTSSAPTNTASTSRSNAVLEALDDLLAKNKLGSLRTARSRNSS
jgi:subtilisin family serine protease